MAEPQLKEFVFGEMTWDRLIHSHVKIIKTVKTAHPKINREIMCDSFFHLEKLDNRVAEIYINEAEYNEMRKTGKDILDVFSNKDDLKRGIMAMVWGAFIIVNKKIPIRNVLILTEFPNKSAVLLELGEDTFEGAKELISYADRLDDISRELQSVMSRSKKIIHDMISIAE